MTPRGDTVSQNRKFAFILIIAVAQKAHFFVCKRTGFVNHMFEDFAKITLPRIIECIWSRIESFDQKRDPSRVTKNRDSSRVIHSSHVITAVFKQLHSTCETSKESITNFKQKTDSRKNTHRQSSHLQAMLTGETLKG